MNVWKYNPEKKSAKKKKPASQRNKFLFPHFRARSTKFKEEKKVRGKEMMGNLWTWGGKMQTRERERGTNVEGEDEGKETPRNDEW